MLARTTRQSSTFNLKPILIVRSTGSFWSLLITFINSYLILSPTRNREIHWEFDGLVHIILPAPQPSYVGHNKEQQMFSYFVKGKIQNPNWLPIPDLVPSFVLWLSLIPKNGPSSTRHRDNVEFPWWNLSRERELVDFRQHKMHLRRYSRNINLAFSQNTEILACNHQSGLPKLGTAATSSSSWARSGRSWTERILATPAYVELCWSFVPVAHNSPFCFLRNQGC